MRYVIFSPDGTQLLTVGCEEWVAGCRRSSAQLWDVETGERIHVLHHPGQIYSAAFNPSGTQIVTTGCDAIDRYGSCIIGTTRLWDTMTGQEVHILKGHTGLVEVGSFNPSGTLVVTGGEDGTARLWDVATGNPLAVFEGHLGTISSVAFSPDGTEILTASWDKTVRLWPIQPLTLEELLEEADRRLGPHQLTDEDCQRYFDGGISACMR